jgi:hypothetical protein
VNITFADMTLAPEDVASLRQSIIELRDEALKQNDFQWAVTLSHVVAVLAWTMEAMNDRK